MSWKEVQLLRTANLPKSLTTLDRLVLFFYADAYWPKLGKAILPGHELDRLTGVHSKSNERSRGRLVRLGALIRITKGFPGQASEYAVSEKWLQQYQVTDRLPNSRNRKQQPGDRNSDSYQDVAPELPTGNSTATDKLPDSYSILKDQETKIRKDKELVSNFQLQPKSAPTRINVERWQVVTAQMPSNVKRLIDPGANYERLLDELVRQGWKLPAVADRLGRTKWGNAGKCGAILDYVLRELAGVARPRQDDSPPWCERDGCDPLTRTWVEPSSRSDGSMTHNCPQCHRLEVRTTTASAGSPELRNFLDENLKDFGKLD